MSNGHNIIVPAVPLAKSKDQTLSSASSSTGSVDLNPDAMTFAPGQSKHTKMLSVNASEFVPKLASLSTFDDSKKVIADNKNGALDVAMIESPTAKDLTDPSNQTFGEKVHFVSESGTFVLVCNTQDLSQSPLSFDVLEKLVAANDLPHKVQLIIFAGPRLQHIHNAARWFVETLGSSMRTLHKVQIVIVRCGECTSGNWVIPQLDFEKFEPLHHFVAELIQVLPKHVDMIWGASEELTLALRKHYLSAANTSHQNAVGKDSDNGVTRYSESIGSAMLKNIGSQYLRLQGKKTYPTFDSNPSTATYVNTPSLILDRSGASSSASVLNPNASSFNPGTNPEARMFTPASVNSRPPPLYTPHLHHPSSLPVDSYDSFSKQLHEVDANRHGWIPSVYDYDTQNDSNGMYDYNETMVRRAHPINFEGLPVDYMYGGNMHMPMQVPGYGAQAPSYLTNSTPAPDYSCYSPVAPYATPVYATALQYAQQGLGKKGKKGGYKKGGKPRRDQDFNRKYDVGFVSHPPSTNNGCDTYGFAVPRSPYNGSGFDMASGNEYGAYPRTYDASFENGNGHGNGNDSRYNNGYTGPDSRGAGPKGKRNKHKFNKKNQQNEYAGDRYQNEHARDRHMNECFELPHKDEYTRNRFHNDYSSNRPVNANHVMPADLQNSLQLPRQQDEYRNSSDSFDNSTQFPQQEVRAEYRHESRTGDSRTSMEFGPSPVPELPQPARGASDPPSRNTNGEITDMYGELEPEEMADRTIGGDGDVAKVDTVKVDTVKIDAAKVNAVKVDLPLRITYADVARGKGISKGLSAAAKANTGKEGIGAFDDVGDWETQVQMDEEIKGKGDGEADVDSSEARDVPHERPTASW